MQTATKSRKKHVSEQAIDSILESTAAEGTSNVDDGIGGVEMVAESEIRTHEMTVDDMTFLVDRLHADCARGQFVRELTKNAIQAAEYLMESGGASKCQVAWDFDKHEGVKKLIITDTGIGMTGPEMVDHINRLSSSGRRQGNAYNYGVGAKISALPLNREGMIYISKKAGEKDGALVHLWFDPVAKKYGIMQQSSGGRHSQWAHVPTPKLPPEIQKHGTRLILLGNDLDQDTTEQPDGLTGKKRWLFKYLSSRFYRIPRGIELRVNVEREEGGREDPRLMRGLEQWLKANAVKDDTVRLTGATAHWFILKEGTDAASGMYPNLGLVGALWQDELYDLVTGSAANPRMIAFGVVFETKRVVIIVEPDPKKYPALTSDTARTRLLIDGVPLTWSEWAREFRENLPQPLEDLQHEAASRSDSGDVRKNIVERLKLNLDLFKVSRYRRTVRSPLRADPYSVDDATGEATGDEGEPPPPTGRGGRGSSRGRAERPSRFYSSLLSDDSGTTGVIVEQVEVSEKIPEVKFLSLDDKTRQSGDLEDRAARYVPETNILFINEDFRVLADMRGRWERAYKGNEAAKMYARERVREWFSQQLVEAVMTGRALAGTSQHWTDDEVERGVYSETALTAAILPRYHIDKALKREMGSKFGKVSEEALEVE